MNKATPITKARLRELAAQELASEQLELVSIAEPREAKEGSRWIVYFAARCSCGVVAMISLEVMADRSYEQVQEALPGLHQHLASRAKSFYAMSCQVHQRMSSSPLRPPDGS